MLSMQPEAIFFSASLYVISSSAATGCAFFAVFISL